ncbi:MAG: GNAT family protein [Planctomycetota bacterium]
MSDLAGFSPRQIPGKHIIRGEHVTVEPVDWDRHGESLAAQIAGDENAGLWTYIPAPAAAGLEELRAGAEYASANLNWSVMAIVRNADARALGMASYMRIRAEHGSAEVGCIIFGRQLQRTRAATEAMYLMAKHAFDDLGYRRYEWKCDDRNEASKRAAERYGFKYEGLFRNDLVVKGQNRDTAWFAMTDSDWPDIRAGFERWLADENFDEDGSQKKSLRKCRQ